MAPMKRLKVSAKHADRIIGIVLSDEKLLEYVMTLVSRRLSGATLDDLDWCNTVVDLSIDQVLKEVNVIEMLDQLSRVSHKSKAHKSSIGNGGMDDPQELLRPNFSSTEPKKMTASSPRRVVKELNKKKPIDISKGLSRSQGSPPPVPYNRSTSVESDASTIPVVRTVLDDGAVISNHLKEERRQDNWLSGAFANVRSESSISSNNDDLYASVIESEVNASHLQDSVLTHESGENGHDEEDPYRHSAIDTADQKTATFNPNRTIRLPTVTTSATSLRQSTDSDSARAAVEAENDDFLSSWEQKVLEGLRQADDSSSERDGHDHDGHNSEADNGVVAVLPPHGAEKEAGQHNEVGAADKEKKDAHVDGEEEDDDDNAYSSDTTVSTASTASSSRNKEPGYLRSAPMQSYGTSAGAQLLFFDQSRFDADADFFSAESSNNNSTSSPQRSGGSKTSGKGGKKSKRKALLSDSPKRVRFAPTLVTETHYRDRVGYAEKAELFFTHNEEYQFTLDQSKEMERAEALGISWMEWMNQRTDEDVQREEKAEADALDNFKLYSGDYFEEDERVSPVEELLVHSAVGAGAGSVTGSSGGASTGAASSGGASRVQADAAGHNFKSANAHAPPVLSKGAGASTSPPGQRIPAVPKAPAGAGTAGSAMAKMSSLDELSLPSCSDEDEEYDFDDF